MNIDDFPFHELADLSDTQEDLVNRISERMTDTSDAKKVVRIYIDLGILDPKWLPTQNAEYIYAPYVPLLMTDRVGEVKQLTPNYASRYGQSINSHLYKKVEIWKSSG